MCAAAMNLVRMAPVMSSHAVSPSLRAAAVYQAAATSRAPCSPGVVPGMGSEPHAPRVRIAVPSPRKQRITSITPFLIRLDS